MSTRLWRGMPAAASRFHLFNLRHVTRHRLRSLLVVSVVALSAALIVAVFGTYGWLTG